MQSVTYKNLINEGDPSAQNYKCIVQPGDKPAVAKPLVEREQKAYEDLQNTPLKDFIPTYYGTDKHDGKDYLITADLNAGLENLCYADLKMGRRLYDADATDVKRNKVLKKQEGSTTESLGVRLDEAKITSKGSEIQSWDKYSGLSFNYDQFQDFFNEFIPQKLRQVFADKVGKIYDAFSDTLDQYPAFRMYKPTLLISYDHEKADDIRVYFIQLKHTHLDISKLECDPDDDEYEDGVFQGLASLMNFAETSLNATPQEKGELDITVTETREEGDLKTIKKCIVNPGEHHCIMRSPDLNESIAYTIFMPTPISNFMPRLYGIQNKQVVIEDINSDFKSPCMADFKVGCKTYDIDDKEDIINQKKAIDDSTTTGRFYVRLSMAVKTKNGKKDAEWSKNSGDINSNESNLRNMILQYCPEESMRKKIAESLNSLKEAYEDTLIENTNLRMYNASVLICYDGDDPKKAPKCLFSKLGQSHLDIDEEGFSTGPENDDKFRDGIINLIKYFSPTIGEKAETTNGSSSKCCLLI